MKVFRPNAVPVRFFEACLFCGMLLVGPSAGAQSLQIRGTVEYTSFKNNDAGAVSFQHHDQFSIAVFPGGQWRMRYDTTGFKDGFFESAFDGKETTRVMYTSRHRDENGKEIAAFSFAQGNHPATVSGGPYFFDGWPGERFVWFALAAGTFLKSSESIQMPAIWAAPRHDPVAHAGFSQAVTLGGSVFSFPDQAEWMTKSGAVAPSSTPTGLVLPHTEGVFQMQKERNQLLRGFEPGLSAARYSVMSTSNAAGQVVPKNFQLDVYWPGRGVMKISQRVAEQFAGSVTNISPLANSFSKAEIAGQLTVDDFRFYASDKKTAVHAIRYRIADGKWKAQDDPELLARFAATKQAVAPYKPIPGINRKVSVIVLLFFAFVSASVLGWLIWHKRVSTPSGQPLS